MHEHITIALVSIVVLGVGAQWLAWRLHFPAIVLLTSFGLIAGPVMGHFGLPHLDPAETFGESLRSIVSLCVAIILFEGGLSLHIHELKVAAIGVRRLVYAGAPLAWGLTTLAAHYIGDLSWPVSLLFGAIMVVTGPTVIIPLLRQAGLNRRTASYFKWEGIINDPIGALFAVFVFQFFSLTESGSGWDAVATGLAYALLSGAILGGLGGWLTGKAFQHGMVPEYLKSPVMLMLVLVVYTISNILQHEAGLLSVTVMGIVVGNMGLAGIEDMKRFKEYITVMLVASVFILLTADLKWSVLSALDWRGIALVGAVLFVVRPLTIFFATLRTDVQIKERILLGWIAPRGIVAAATAGVFGPLMAQAGYEGSETLLPLVFAVIIATVVLHGASIGFLSRRLGLAAKNKNGVLIVGASPWSTGLAKTLQQLGLQVMIADSSWHNLRPARLDGVPVFYGEILSDFADESVETAHIGSVLAATSNDAYNALVCTAMAPELGRSKVFQLPMGSADDDPRGVARSLRGKLAFGNDAVFERLWRDHVSGWVFYKTRLTDGYTYSDLLGDISTESLKILVLREDGQVELISPQRQVEPVAGDTVVYFAPERSDADEPEPASGT
ncbi:MAG: sodium:proton antiporter [Pseudomonadota bacterium]